MVEQYRKKKPVSSWSRVNFVTLLPVRISKLRVEDRDPKADDSVSLYGLTLSNVVPLEKCFYGPRLGEVRE